MGKYVERGSKAPHLIDLADPPAVVMIKEDHQAFRALFDMAEEADGRTLTTLAGVVCIRLAIHMAIEEEILYPALRPFVGVDVVDRSILEHQRARQLIAEIAEISGREEMFKTKLHFLGEEVMHHIDQEDCTLLCEARRAWEDGKIDLVLIASQMTRPRQVLNDLVSSIGQDDGSAEVPPMGEQRNGSPNGPASREPVGELATGFGRWKA